MADQAHPQEHRGHNLAQRESPGGHSYWLPDAFAELSISECIRRLAAEGWTRWEIHQVTGIRYQHVRNVLEQKGSRAAAGLSGGVAMNLPAPEQASLPNGMRTTLAEFLQWEDAQPVRHERVGGRMWAMTGGTLDHNRIALNLALALRRQLQGTNCEAFVLDIRVVTPRGDVMYPDVVVACGSRRGRDNVIDDPIVVIEVLSPSTEAHDHGHKRWAYSAIATLRHYVLIAQDCAEAEVASVEGETWRSMFLRDRGASLRLEALGLEVPLQEVYAGVDLADERNGAPSMSRNGN
jgi:Uma2 family endonuclease